MDLRQLENFLLVAEKGSLSRAAQDAFISPQAMLQQMNSLEAEIGVQLFERGPRGVRCTPAGSFLRDRLGTLSKYFGDILCECKRIGEEVPQVVRVGRSSIPIFVSVAERAFMRSHLTASVEHVEIEMADAFTMLLNEAVDIVEIGSYPVNMPNGIVYSEVASFKLMCVMSSDNSLASKEAIEVNDLEGYEVGTRDGCLTYDSERADQALLCKRFEIEPLTKDEAITFCLNGGVFIAHLPSTAVVFPLVCVPLGQVQLKAGLLTRETPSPIIAQFVDTAKIVFGI